MTSQKKMAEQKARNVSQKEGSQQQNEIEQDSAGEDASALIRSDHRKVEALFSEFEEAHSEEKKAELVTQICTELIVHAMIEEELLYPACREHNVKDDMLDEAQVEHDSVKMLISELMGRRVGSEFYDAKVKVLSEYVKHHVTEEEMPEDGILVKAEQAGIDMSALEQKLQERKKELLAHAASGGLNPPVPRTLHLKLRTSQEYQDMDRYDNPDRDERGRFVRHDDDDRGGRYSRSDRDDDQRRTRSRYDEDEDRRGSRAREEDNGRGWHGDPERHSEAARRGWDERGYSRSHSRDGDYDDRQRSRSYEDENRPRSGRGGWSGDSEGHSEASRRGWEERGSNRSRSRDEDYSDRGTSRSREEGHGGWYGDSRGHAEAARRGWDDRRSSPSSRSRDDDDDRRRSRSRDDEGHGGWFGDSRGHAEAARRGWQNRDR